MLLSLSLIPGIPCTSFFTYFEEGEWSQTATLVQLVSVKIMQGAGKYLFGKILPVNYRGEFLSFYYRESNDCEILDEKVTRLSHFFIARVCWIPCILSPDIHTSILSQAFTFGDLIVLIFCYLPFIGTLNYFVYCFDEGMLINISFFALCLCITLNFWVQLQWHNLMY